VPGQKHRPENFPGPEQMMQVGPAVLRASRAIALGIEGGGIVGEARIPEVVDPGARIGPRGAAGSGRDHTIEHIDATLDAGENVVRGPDTHQIARGILGEMGDGRIERLQHDGLAFPDRQSAEGIAIEPDLPQRLG